MQAAATGAVAAAAGVAVEPAAQPGAPPPAPAGLSPGQLVARRWRILARIGRGAFGDIFVAEWDDSEPDPSVPPDPADAAARIALSSERRGRQYAVKIEKLSADASSVPPLAEGGDPAEHAAAVAEANAAAAARAVLKLEAVILSKMQKYPCVGRFVEYGRDLELSVAYLVMSLLGENLLRLRRRRPTGQFSLPTVLRFGIQALRSIQAIHEVGFIHRDIKPSNFVIGSNRNTLHAAQSGGGGGLSPSSSSSLDPLESQLLSPARIAIIDFGLARAFRDRTTGKVLPSRGHVKGFRGTPRYASVHVHREEDLSRRDDLWSLLYVLVEFLVGDLPWGHLRDKDAIGEVKEKYMSLRLLKSKGAGGGGQQCPSCFVPFMQHLYSLQFESKPNYAYLIELLQGKLLRMGLGAEGEEAPFDWEDLSTLSTMDGSSSLHAAPSPCMQPTPLPPTPPPPPRPATTLGHTASIEQQQLRQDRVATQVALATPMLLPSAAIPTHSPLLHPSIPIAAAQPQETGATAAPATAGGVTTTGKARPTSTTITTPTMLSLPLSQAVSVSLPLAPAAAAATGPRPATAPAPGSAAGDSTANNVVASPSLPISVPAAAAATAVGLPSAAVVAVPVTLPSSASSSPSSFVSLPLAQPMPLSSTAFVSPRKLTPRQGATPAASAHTAAAAGSGAHNAPMPDMKLPPPAEQAPSDNNAAPREASHISPRQQQRERPGHGSAAAAGQSPAATPVAVTSVPSPSAGGLSMALKPPRHTHAPALRVFVPSDHGAGTGSVPSPASTLLAPSPSPSQSQSSSHTAGGALSARGDLLLREDQRADMAKQRTQMLPVTSPGLSWTDAPQSNQEAQHQEKGGAAPAPAVDWSVVPHASPFAAAGGSVTMQPFQRNNSGGVSHALVEPIREPSTSTAAPASSTTLARPGAPPTLLHDASSSDSSSSTATADRDDEGGGGDGRTLAPITLALRGGDPAQSLNDAYIGGRGGEGESSNSMQAPEQDGRVGAAGADTMHWMAAAGVTAAACDDRTSLSALAHSQGHTRSRAPTATSLGVPPHSGLLAPHLGFSMPSDSPHASPMRNVVGSMLLVSSDSDSSSSSSDEESSSSDTAGRPAVNKCEAVNSAIPMQPLTDTVAVSLAVHSPPRSRMLPGLSLTDTVDSARANPLVQLPFTTPPSSAPHTPESRQRHPAPTDAAAATALSSAPPCPPLPLSLPVSSPSHPAHLRPVPPSQPPPAYSTRAFGRFRRGAGASARTPAKPLTQEQITQHMGSAEEHTQEQAQ